MESEQKKPCWKNRRRVIFITLLFCAGLIVYMAGWGEDTRINETIVYGAFGLGVTVILGYVFGAVVEDVGLFRHRK